MKVDGPTGRLGGRRGKHVGRSGADAPLRRDERKQRTREGLMDAALRLMQQGRSFTGLGLREITREAGVVPTSFYRHFRDMDDLGLSLVEESAITLRRLLREARRVGQPGPELVRRSVEIYFAHVKQRPLEFLFIAGERSGGSPVIRKAIRREIDYFSAELAQDVRHLGIMTDLSQRMTHLVCELVTTTMLNAAGEVLDIKQPSGDEEAELVEHYVRQLTIIFLGAMHWKQSKSDMRPDMRP